MHMVVTTCCTARSMPVCISQLFASHLQHALNAIKLSLQLSAQVVGVCCLLLPSCCFFLTLLESKQQALLRTVMRRCAWHRPSCGRLLCCFCRHRIVQGFVVAVIGGPVVAGLMAVATEVISRAAGIAVHCRVCVRRACLTLVQLHSLLPLRQQALSNKAGCKRDSESSTRQL